MAHHLLFHYASGDFAVKLLNMYCMGKSKTITISRSAKTGQFVSQKYADSHPATTVTEHRQKKS